MKILFASSVQPSLSSGVGNVEYNLTEGLRKRGVQVEGYYPKTASMALTDFAKGFRLANKAMGFDLVHSHTDISWNLPQAVRTFHGVAALGELHYRTEPHRALMPKHKQEAYFAIHKALEGQCARNNKCVAVSNYVKNALVKFYGAREDNVTTIYNGIDGQKFRPNAALGRAFRRKYGIPSQAVLLTWVGHAEFNKGIAYLVETLNWIAQKDGETAFAVRSPLDVNGLRKMGLGRQAAERTYAVGVEPTLAGMYNASDVHLLTSVYEPFCLTLLEAMACAKPVVASRSGGHEEMIGEDSGVLTPLRDSRAMARAALGLAGDGKKRRAMGKNAMKTVLSGFTKEHMVENHLRYYEATLRK